MTRGRRPASRILKVRFGELLEHDGLHRRGLDVRGDADDSVTLKVADVRVAQGRRQVASPLRVSDQQGARPDRDFVPAEQAGLDVQHREDLGIHHAHQRRGGLVGVDDRQDVVAGPVDLGVDVCLSRRLLLTLDEVAIEIDHDHVVGGESVHAARLRRVFWLDDNAIGSGDARTRVAEIIDELLHVENLSRRRDQLAQLALVSSLWHSVAPTPHRCRECRTRDQARFEVAGQD